MKLKQVSQLGIWQMPARMQRNSDVKALMGQKRELHNSEEYKNNENLTVINTHITIKQW